MPAAHGGDLGSLHPPSPHLGLPRSSAAPGLCLRQVPPALGGSPEHPQIAPRASTDPGPAGSLGNPQPAPAARVPALGPRSRAHPPSGRTPTRGTASDECACAAEASAAPAPARCLSALCRPPAGLGVLLGAGILLRPHPVGFTHSLLSLVFLTTLETSPGGKLFLVFPRMDCARILGVLKIFAKTSWRTCPKPPVLMTGIMFGRESAL